MTFIKLAFLCLLCSCSSCELQNSIPSNEISGKVIGIKDGDTIELLCDSKPLIVRLEHIDCPELKSSQPFAKAAKQFTSVMCFGQIVTIINENKYDRYRRLIGVVINTHGQNVNKELLTAGLAWHYRKYSTDKVYAKLEEHARSTHVGLWKEQTPVAPWNWRNRKR